MQEMKLIPFTIKSVQTEINEVPYGVQQLNAPIIWAKRRKGGRLRGLYLRYRH